MPDRKKMYHIKDITKEELDYFAYKRKRECKLKHVVNWLKLFWDFHNGELNIR